MKHTTQRIILMASLIAIALWSSGPVSAETDIAKKVIAKAEAAIGKVCPSSGFSGQLSL